MTTPEKRDLREVLRVKYLPFADGFDVGHLDEYERFLGLTDDEQQIYMSTVSDDAAELFIALLTARALYKDPVDRHPGSITQDKVDAYPDRYQWEIETAHVDRAHLTGDRRHDV